MVAKALHALQVEVMSKSDRASKAETAFKLFDKNRDGFITKEEFTQVWHNPRWSTFG